MDGYTSARFNACQQKRCVKLREFQNETAKGGYRLIDAAIARRLVKASVREQGVKMRKLKLQMQIKNLIILLVAGTILLFAESCDSRRADNERTENMKNDKNSVQHINPDGLHKNPAYSQVIVVSSAAKTVYVGGQNAVDASGAVVGKGDLKAQAEQVFKNLQTALEAGGAKLENVVKWNIYVVEGQPIEQGFEVFQHNWGNRPNPPVITTVFVSKLAHPDFLVEIDATAVVPQ